MITGVFAGFYEEVDVGANQAFYASESQYFHVTGNSKVTISGNTISVTNYAANSANELINDCGSTATYSTFALSIGTPSGTSFPIITNLNIAGTDSSGAFSYTLQVTAFTVA